MRSHAVGCLLVFAAILLGGFLRGLVPPPEPPTELPAAAPAAPPVQPTTPGAPPLDADTRTILDAVNAARSSAGGDPLAIGPDLQAAAAGLISDCLAADSLDPVGGDRLETLVPGLASWQALLLTEPSVPLLASQVAGSEAAGDPESTHLGVALSPVPGGRAALAIVGRLLPELTAEGINAGQDTFHAVCHLCGRSYLTGMEPVPVENRGALAVECPACRRIHRVYGLDTADQYHPPAWFVRHFSPGRIARPTQAWVRVLRGCRYQTDPDTFGRPEVWQLATQTWARKAGDCEDVAVLLADWLTANGYEARVAAGQCQGEGHAWVVLRDGERQYLLEATGGLGNYHRVPPRTSLQTEYLAEYEFDRSGAWYRTDGGWTGDYFGESGWGKDPGEEAWTGSL